MFGSSGRVWDRVGFDPLICWFFGFGLFQARVKKIVFKIQNFRAGLGLVNFLQIYVTLINQHTTAALVVDWSVVSWAFLIDWRMHFSGGIGDDEGYA